MGATESHSADDEANVLGQRSLRPLNAELRSGTRPPLCVSCKGQPLCVCVYISLKNGELDISHYITQVSKRLKEGVLKCLHGNVAKTKRGRQMEGCNRVAEVGRGWKKKYEICDV